MDMLHTGFQVSRFGTRNSVICAVSEKWTCCVHIFGSQALGLSPRHSELDDLCDINEKSTCCTLGFKFHALAELEVVDLDITRNLNTRMSNFQCRTPNPDCRVPGAESRSPELRIWHLRWTKFFRHVWINLRISINISLTPEPWKIFLLSYIPNSEFRVPGPPDPRNPVVHNFGVRGLVKCVWIYEGLV
jgi:hypothetical protein